VLSDDPRVMKDATGRALVSPELVVVINRRRKDGADVNVTSKLDTLWRAIGARS